MAEMFAALLERRALALDLALSTSVLEGCAQHFALLVKWNQTHNLTRITAPDEAAVKHYLDCIVPLVSLAAPQGFIDVGSGAGFPGLVAALLWPEVTAVLVEPSQKRQSFLRVAAGQLGLRHVRVVAPDGGLTAPLVLTRATFSAGERGALWSYVEVGGALLGWSTEAENSEWRAEVATWNGATMDVRAYDIGAPDRCIVRAQRSL